MLRSRIIPALLIHQNGLVKTVKFSEPKYVGDPINAVKIFNEKFVDELIVLDIDKSVKSQGPDFELIRKIAIECRMPFCYGGGISNVDQAKMIISLGAEKIALSSAAISNPKLVNDISREIGVQSVVVVLDVKKKFFGGYDTYIYNGKKNVGEDPIKLALKFEELGAGELVINSIDKDGVMNGYDIEIFDRIRNEISIPITILGGSGTLDHMKLLVDKYKILGLAAGSMFVFKGKYKAVLISYPSDIDKIKILNLNDQQ
ncbi:MAG: imidazole glycerol phosphate synthase subunit HisF [Cytophagaceae bacterium]|nr:imidazole glycerol phosphate synthase subunit HisF [Cytophagaceae bacterium]